MVPPKYDLPVTDWRNEASALYAPYGAGFANFLSKVRCQQFQQGFCHAYRRLARQKVPGDGDDAALIRAGKETPVVFRTFGRINAVAGAVQHDCRHRDLRLRGESLLQLIKRRIAGRCTVPMAVRMDNHLDKIRVIERYRGASEGGIVESPVRRPQLPQQAA